MHSLWLSLIVPGLAIVFWRAPVVRRSHIWFPFAMLFGILVLSLGGLYVWNHLYPDASIAKAGQLMVYRMLTMTEVPFIQLTLGGVVNLGLCRWFAKKSVQPKPFLESPPLTELA